MKKMAKSIGAICPKPAWSNALIRWPQLWEASMNVKKNVKSKGSGTRKAGDAGEFMRELDHPLKRDIDTVRQIILNVDPGISEAIKWNAPSFRTTDFFATVNLRSRECVQLIFHTGAKAKATATTGISIADPAGLLEWLAKDRCRVTLGVGKDIQTKRAAFEAIVREWIRWV
jgi:hypothetical protein